MKTEPLSERDLEVWQSFKKMGYIVKLRIERDLIDAVGLSEADFRVLSSLVDLGGGQLRQKDIGRSLEWHKSRLSHHLNKMEARALIKRRDDDWRVVVVSITPTGNEKLRAARLVHAASIRRWLLDRLSEGQADVVVSIAPILAREFF